MAALPAAGAAAADDAGAAELAGALAAVELAGGAATLAAAGLAGAAEVAGATAAADDDDPDAEFEEPLLEQAASKSAAAPKLSPALITGMCARVKRFIVGSRLSWMKAVRSSTTRRSGADRFKLRS